MDSNSLGFPNHIGVFEIFAPCPEAEMLQLHQADLAGLL